MRVKYMKLKNMKGAKRAIIAIARNLIIRIRRILLNNEPYVVGNGGIRIYKEMRQNIIPL